MAVRGDEIALGPSRAQAVLGAIKALTEWKRQTDEWMDRGMARLAKLVVEAKTGRYWEGNYPSEDAWIADVFPGSRSQYYALLDIGRLPLPMETVETIGRCKAEDLARIKRHFGCLPPEWIKAALEESTTEFRIRVRKVLGENSRKDIAPGENVEFFTARLVGQQIDVVHRALSIYEKALGTERSRGFTLEMMAADCLSSGEREDGSGGYIDGQNWFILASCRDLLSRAAWSPEFESQLVSMIAALVESTRNGKHEKEPDDA